MTGPDTETLTAALRRLADEHASGLLSVATPGRDVVVELTDGVPVAIGPAHDVTARIGGDAGDGLTAAAVVDGLIDRMVAAIIHGGGDWAWDVASEAERIAVPEGLVEELARRAVDAAQALAVLDPDDVLDQGHDVETNGELGRVRQLFDGDRSIEDVADEAGLTVPATATMAAALVAAGALATADEAPATTTPMSWSDAVRASEDDDEDDEPELWVMEPAEDEEFDDDEFDDDEFDDDEFDDEDDVPADDVATPAAAAPSSTPLFSDVGATEDGERDEVPAAASPEDAPDELDQFDDLDDLDGLGDVATPAAAAAPPASEPAGSEPAAAGAGQWNDTTWLDELAPQDSPAGAPPVLAAGDEEPADARAALSSMLNDLQPDEAPAPAAPTAPEASEPDRGEADDKLVAERREPKAEPGEVAEFLRELSRLALDDD